MHPNGLRIYGNNSTKMLWKHNSGDMADLKMIGYTFKLKERHFPDIRQEQHSVTHCVVLPTHGTTKSRQAFLNAHGIVI